MFDLEVFHRTNGTLPPYLGHYLEQIGMSTLGPTLILVIELSMWIRDCELNKLIISRGVRH